MKQSFARITIITLVIVGLLMVGYGLTIEPSSTAQAVSNGHIESVSFPSDTQARYAMQNDVQSSLIGDCLADRVTGDLYPMPDPYCLPVPSVAVVETVKRDTEDTHTPVIVETPATPETPETPVIIDNGGEDVPTEPNVTPEPEQPETPEPSQAGNPGNTKDVGNAGENPNGRGTMDNDNAGGNGNGEHGNQGEGGHNNG
jgi:hypothetical protein